MEDTNDHDNDKEDDAEDTRKNEVNDGNKADVEDDGTGKEKNPTNDDMEEKPQTNDYIEENPQTNDDIEENPQTNDDIEENPQTNDDIEEKPQTNDDIEEKPQTNDDIDENTQTNDDIEEHPQTNDDIEEKEQSNDDIEGKKTTNDNIEEKNSTNKEIEEKKTTNEDIEEKVDILSLEAGPEVDMDPFSTSYNEEDDDDNGVTESKITLGAVLYEWDEELEEYDEPDVYPSEKDYKLFEEVVTDSDEENEMEVEVEVEVEVPKMRDDVSDNLVEEPKADLEQQGKETHSGEDATEEREGDDDDAEEQFVPTQILDQEEEVEEIKRKRYKTIMVRRLVERPPKIYHVPEEVRIEDKTNSKDDFPSAPFRFLHSFGYDCQRLANLIVLDKTTLLFMSGFVLTFYDYNTCKKNYLRSLGGGSFGSLAIHPSRKLFAAAEMGRKPLIGIWSWPKLQLFRKLEEGTEKIYASVNFSPDGKLLASQGGGPDYLITVWNWLAETPVLRVKSHAQDVYRVTFAKELAGLLTTSGVCHIKFWKMARTFTGLKLKGDLGRFGRTELSDIEGYVEMPDGKVLSGSEWGNLLVWENGLVIAELCTAKNVPCHSGIVRQISIIEGDFYTTGQDGCIRVWGFDDVDTAEIQTSTESLKVAIKPLAGVVVQDAADIWSIFQDPYNNDDMSVFWFAQDGKGYIWKVDLSFLNVAKEPTIMLTAHGGPIVGSSTSPFDFMIATLGGDGKVLIYDYITKQMLALRSFSAPGSCIIWPSQGVCDDGCTLIAGFSDGVLRILTLSGQPEPTEMPLSICIRRVWKPHRTKINSISLDSEGEFLVTGSEDGTVFFFHASNDFMPMVYVNPSDSLPVHKVFWSKAKDDSDQRVVIVVCKGSFIQEIEMPMPNAIDNSVSYYYKDAKLLRCCTVKSIKSVLRHNEELARMRIAEEERQKNLEKENQRLLDEGLETVEDQIARLLEEAEEIERTRGKEARQEKKWTPYIPITPNSILEVLPDPFDADVLHLTIDDYDSGYLYSVRLVNEDIKEVMAEEAGEPFSAIAIEGSDDVPVNKMVFINNGTDVLMGFQDGRIRMARMVYPYDLESIKAHWTICTHDVARGRITSIALDSAESFLFTTAIDGNWFMHTFLDGKKLKEMQAKTERIEIPIVQQRTDVHDIIVSNAYTLEDSKNVEKERAMLAAAKRNKAARKEKIAQLRMRFTDILHRNNELPQEIRLTPVELSLASDSAARKQKRSQKRLEQVSNEMAWLCEHAKIALKKIKTFYVDRGNCELFVLKAFKSIDEVSSFRLANYPSFFEDAKYENSKTQHGTFTEYEAHDDGDSVGSMLSVCEEPRPKRKRGMDKFVHQKLVRIWERRQKRLQRKREWDEFMKTDPSEHKMEDEITHINNARFNTGDMKLKMDPNYKVPDNLKLTVRGARSRLIDLEQNMFELQKVFNDELLMLRANKTKTISRLEDFREKIKACQLDIAESQRLSIPDTIMMTVEEDPQALVKVRNEDVLLFKHKQPTKPINVVVTSKAVKKTDVPKKRQRKSIVAIKAVEEVVVKEKDIGAYVEHIVCRPSPLELQIEHMKQTNAMFYQKYYIDCIEKEKFKFDAKLKLLRHKKVKLDYDLKIAEARMIILTEEFILAQKSVAMEARLENSVKKATNEKRICTNAMKALQKNVDSLRKEIDSLSSQRAALLKEVQDIASEVPSYEKYLIRVFRKKMSVVKRNTKVDEDEESEDSDDSDDSDDMDIDDDDESDDGLDVDLPPQDLKEDIYDAVVKVRNRRLGLDEVEIKAKSLLDDLTLQINGYKSRIENADKTFQQTKQELDQFNLEKQSKLNSIEDTVSLNLHQILYMNIDLEQSLVTTKANVKRLRDRIPELMKEKKTEKKRVLTTRKEYYRLLHEDDQFKERLVEMDKQCDKEMLLKFGRVKPVTELELYKEDPEISRLRRDLCELQEKNNQVLYDLEHQISFFNDECSKLAVSHTAKTRMMVDMRVELQAITTAMDASIGVMPREVEDTRSAVEILRLQEDELRMTAGSFLSKKSNNNVGKYFKTFNKNNNTKTQNVLFVCLLTKEGLYLKLYVPLYYCFYWKF